jgi:SAM-dependent methyltransferase
VREWLNSQAAGGYVDYHPSSATYALSPEQAAVLADEESGVFFPPAWDCPSSMYRDEELALEAFRTGRGVAWSEHDDRLACGVAAFFRNTYRREVVQNWIPSLQGVEAKLRRGAVVADIGCGHGHSTIFMARAYPDSHFHGFDTHEGSIRAARENAKREGLGERVTFEIATAQSFEDHRYDLVCFFDCLHDMGDPVGALIHTRETLADGGTVMAVEPFANDRLEDNFNPVGRLYYSASTTICCAHALSEKGGYALGAQAGEARLGKMFQKAGFTHFRRATENAFNLVLEARA